ncbi:MAG: asparagine synthase (glutamine-hydrolyzing) [Chitinophagales bacterium]|nr:asparagine synthase (glutamine-hydrolyzing) [Chitinophagales bacterium]MDW8274235.1 asparagine synthase (glutamine-hydrolyzing) [Chitinophagales bacterium]
MCGIAGIISYQKVFHEKDLLQNLAQSLKHRGPDGSGIFSNESVSLVHSRLSIIDPWLGQQPMLSSDKAIAITYNGEIYNFKLLRKELEELGHLFQTHSDTEVIIAAYREWGKNCVRKFRGMFAFCVADFVQKKCLLARDHLGIKPLVYYSKNGLFAFASEIQSLRLIPNFDKEIKPESLDYYLWLSYIPAPYSIFKNVWKLPPAHFMEVDFSGRILNIEKFWKIEYKPNYRIKTGEWIERTETVLKDSVKAHLVSDVPFGAFLSGGIDSTLVVKYMTETLDTPVKAFTISFHEQDFNELPYARQAAQSLGAELYHEVVMPDALGILPDLVKHYGEPYADSSAVPTYYVSKMARQYVPMVLSGDGGDECFLGYPRYYTWLQFLKQKLEVPLWKALLLPLAHALFPHRYSPLRPKPHLYNFIRFTEYLKLPVRKILWKADYHHFIQQRWRELEEQYNALSGAHPLNKARFADQNSYMVYDILTKVDIASMMNSLEVRTPIIDKEVFEFSATVPPEILINLNDKDHTDKYLLKSILAKTFPSDFVHRRKSGFGMPLQHWLDVKTGNLFPSVQKRLTDPGSPLAEYFTKEGIDLLVNKRDYQRHIGTEQVVWQLLFLDEWLLQLKNA